MKIECTVEEFKTLMNKETSNAGTSDVNKVKKTILEVLNQEFGQNLLIHIDSKSPSLIALKESLKKK